MNSFEEQREAELYRMVQKALYIAPASRPITLETDPRDGFEFIHKSRLEDANLDYCLNLNVNELSRSDTPKSSMKHWGRKQAEEFSRITSKLRTGKEMLRRKFPKVIETPELDDKEWCTFCLGSELCSKIYGEEPQRNFEKGYQPLLSIVLHLSQKQIMMLISYHYKWFQMVGIKHDIGKWVYALFANLEKPVDIEYQEELEAFHDDCRKMVDTSDEPDKFCVYLILSILKNYFCVKSYKVGPPLSRFANK